jgi:hypothetical protein
MCDNPNFHGGECDVCGHDDEDHDLDDDLWPFDDEDDLDDESFDDDDDDDFDEDDSWIHDSDMEDR